MNPRELFLLQTMDISLGLSQENQLSAPQVSELARKGGIGAPETLRLVEDLASQGFVQQHWGGSVSVTAEGKAALNPSPEKRTEIHLGDGAVYVGEGATIGGGAAVGNQAMAQGAVRNASNAQQSELLQAHRELIETVSRLVAGQQRLAEVVSDIPEEAREPAKELTQEMEAVQQELRKPAPDKSAIESRLDKAKSILEKLGGITIAAGKLRPALDLLTNSFEWLRTHLGTTGSWPFTLL